MNFNELKEACSKFNLSLNDEQIAKLQKYADILIETNKVMNLTAIDNLEDVVEKHFYDSLLLFKYFDYKNSSLLDIGSGAGFPGVVLAIMEPTLKVTVLDSTAKKVNFIKSVADKLNLSNISFINSRVEELKKERESLDFVTARAFAALHILVEVGAPLLKVNGSIIAMKSSKAAIEIKQAKGSLEKLSCQIESINEESLATSKDPRINIIIKKNKISSARFPRKWAEITTKPL